MPELDLWNDTATRAALAAFAERAASEVPPEERIAVFDNDGTLWTEKPMPVQLDFMLRGIAAMAEQDEALRSEQPFKAAYEHDMEWLGAAMVKHYQGDDSGLKLLIGAVLKAFGSMSVEDYTRDVEAFFADARHPRHDRLYRDCAYAPMIQLLRYLEGYGFSTYIASGGDRDSCARSPSPCTGSAASA